MNTILFVYENIYVFNADPKKNVLFTMTFFYQCNHMNSSGTDQKVSPRVLCNQFTTLATVAKAESLILESTSY